MKHAYLILAHNEFEVLKLLIMAIDDVRNDIFIHFDKKIEVLPQLETKNAKLHILENRIDVRWGDVSVIEAEYELFEAAFQMAAYSYYHLLSGVDLPLQPQNKIHDFFYKNRGKEFIGFSAGNLKEQLDRKVHRYHLYPKHFRSTGLSIRRIIRFSFLKFQEIFEIRRNRFIEFKKGTQWVSVTNDFIKFLLDRKKEVFDTYHHTFCPDEIFIQTLCWHSSFRSEVYEIHEEGRGSMRMIGWKNNELKPWTDLDYDKLLQSELLFARKFSTKHLDVAKRIIDSNYCK